MHKILLVEDNEMNRYLISRRLARRGFEVSLALDGAEGVEKAACDKPDLIVMDMDLPVLDGYRATRVLKSDENTRRIPIVGLSAHAMSGDEQRAFEAGCDDYDTKPIEWPRLLNKIDGLLAAVGAAVGAAAGEGAVDGAPRGDAGAAPNVAELRRQLDDERRRSEYLLRVLLPDEMVEELKTSRRILPRRADRVALVRGVVDGFQDYCDRLEPLDALARLQALVVAFERGAERHGLLKVRTCGDSIVLAAGLFRPLEEPAIHALRCALELVEESRKLAPDWTLSLGVHLGPVVAGVIGQRSYRLDVWGSTAEVLARIVERGEPAGGVRVSDAVWQEVSGRCTGELDGSVTLAGGHTLPVYRVAGLRDFDG